MTSLLLYVLLPIFHLPAQYSLLYHIILASTCSYVYPFIENLIIQLTLYI